MRWLLAGGFVAAAVLGGPGAASAQERGEDRFFQVSVVTPVQAFPEDDPVRGIRLNLLYGRSASVTGLDVGVVNHTTEASMGLQWGVIGVADGDFLGVQNNWGLNVVRGTMEGFQWGIVNSAGSGRGAQLGVVNHGHDYRGLQVSIVNYARRLEGVQVGVLNIIREGGVFPVLPIVNWSFRRARRRN